MVLVRPILSVSTSFRLILGVAIPVHQQVQVPSTTDVLQVPGNGSAAITPYQSLRNIQNLPIAPQGHPSPSSSSSSTQPFLGFHNISPTLTNQVNQRRLSVAAVHNPRQGRLPSRSRRRGPAIAPPSMPHPPTINDCLIDLTSDAGVATGIRVKVKVYPPQVSPPRTPSI